MKPKTKTKPWKAYPYGHGDFAVSNGEKTLNLRSHCICCSYADAVAKHGGTVDLRGLHSHGICYSFLRAMLQGNSEEGYVL